VGLGLFFDVAGLSPGGWLSSVWTLVISRATAAGFRLAIAVGPLTVSGNRFAGRWRHRDGRR